MSAVSGCGLPFAADMTRKVFWDDPYLTQLTTTVTAVEAAEVRLAASIFFAFSGGQERDDGTIGGNAVVDARWEGSDLVYVLEPAHGLAVGDVVALIIDPDRRDRLRRLHMATELVLEVATQDDPQLVKIGAHIGADKARIDFVADRPLTDRVEHLAEAVNRLIAADRAIESSFVDESAERRYWEIAGFARVPCSGTHPRRTGEIGTVRLRRRNPGRGKERIEVTLA